MKSHKLLRTMSIDTGAVGANPRDHTRRRMALLNKWSPNTRNTRMCCKELLVNPVPWAIVIKHMSTTSENPMPGTGHSYISASVGNRTAARIPGGIYVDARLSLNNLLPNHIRISSN